MKVYIHMQVRSVTFRVRSVNLCKLQYPHMTVYPHDNNYIPTWQCTHTTISSHDNANLPCQCEQCRLRLCSLSQQEHTSHHKGHMLLKLRWPESNQLTAAFHVLWSLTNYGPNQHILSLLTISLFYYL